MLGRGGPALVRLEGDTATWGTTGAGKIDE